MAQFNYINDIEELEHALNEIVEKVIDAVSQKLLLDFQDFLINDSIYSVPEGDVYERNIADGGFYAGWDIESEDVKAIKQYVRRLAFDGSKLAPPTEANEYAHGGRGSGEDLRNDMPAILNSPEGNDTFSWGGGALYMSTYGKEPYWNEYLRSIDKKVEKWLDEEFAKYGIKKGG